MTVVRIDHSHDPKPVQIPKNKVTRVNLPGGFRFLTTLPQNTSEGYRALPCGRRGAPRNRKIARELLQMEQTWPSKEDVTQHGLSPAHIAKTLAFIYGSHVRGIPNYMLKALPVNAVMSVLKHMHPNNRGAVLKSGGAISDFAETIATTIVREGNKGDITTFASYLLDSWGGNLTLLSPKAFKRPALYNNFGADADGARTLLKSGARALQREEMAAIGPKVFGQIVSDIFERTCHYEHDSGKAVLASVKQLSNEQLVDFAKTLVGLTSKSARDASTGHRPYRPALNVIWQELADRPGFGQEHKQALIISMLKLNDAAVDHNISAEDLSKIVVTDLDFAFTPECRPRKIYSKINPNDTPGPNLTNCSFARLADPYETEINHRHLHPLTAEHRDAIKAELDAKLRENDNRIPPADWLDLKPDNQRFRTLMNILLSAEGLSSYASRLTAGVLSSNIGQHYLLRQELLSDDVISRLDQTQLVNVLAQAEQTVRDRNVDTDDDKRIAAQKKLDLQLFEYAKAYCMLRNLSPEKDSAKISKITDKLLATNGTENFAPPVSIFPPRVWADFNDKQKIKALQSHVSQFTSHTLALSDEDNMGIPPYIEKDLKKNKTLRSKLQAIGIFYSES